MANRRIASKTSGEKQQHDSDHRRRRAAINPFRLVNHEAARRIRKVTAIAEFMRLDEANRILGGRKIVGMFVHLGLLTGLCGPGEWMLHGDEVRQLAKSIAAVPTTGETKWVVTLRMYCARTGLKRSEIVQKVLRGEITIAVRDPRQLGVLAWRFSDPNKATPPFVRNAAGFLTRTEVEVLTSFKSTTIAALAEAGVLKTRPNSTRIDPTSAALFHSKYAKAALFHAELGESVYRVARQLEALGVPVRFRDLSHRMEIIVARADLEAVTGVTTEMVSSPVASAVWDKFKAIQGQGYSAFYLPPRVGRHPQRIVPANRKCHFTVHAEEDAVVITKTFSPDKPREWAIFERNRSVFVEALQSFEWKIDGEDEIASIRMRNEEDIKIVRAAFDIVHWHTNKLTRELTRRPDQKPRGPGGIAFTG